MSNPRNELPEGISKTQLQWRIYYHGFEQKKAPGMGINNITYLKYSGNISNFEVNF